MSINMGDSTKSKVKFPTLCIQFLNRENNDKNNTFPLGKQICFTIVWGCTETLPKVNPKMEEYEHEQLDKMLQIFYTEMRTKDGCEYEPESLKSMLAALDRYLKEHDYKYSIIRDREFQQSKLVLEGKVKCLRQQGKGKRPNAANALTAEEEKMLQWKSRTSVFVWTTAAQSTSHLKKILQRRGRED